MPEPSWYAGQLHEKTIGRPVRFNHMLIAGYADETLKINTKFR